MTLIKIKKMLETLLQYEDSEIIHTICSLHNTSPLAILKNFNWEILKRMRLNMLQMQRLHL